MVQWQRPDRAAGWDTYQGGEFRSSPLAATTRGLPECPAARNQEIT